MGRRKEKRRRFSRGFTLVEVMVSLALSASIVAGAFFILRNQSLSEARTQGMADFEALQRDIKRILADPTKCLTAIRIRDTGLVRPKNASLHSPLEIYDGASPLISACYAHGSIPCSDIPRYRYGSILVNYIRVYSLPSDLIVYPGNLTEDLLAVQIDASIPGALGQSQDASSVALNFQSSSPVLSNFNAPILYRALYNLATNAYQSCIYRETNVTACVTPADQSPPPTAPADNSLFVFVGAGDTKTLTFTNVGTINMTLDFVVPAGFSGPASIVVAPGATVNPVFTADIFPNPDGILTTTWTAGTSTGVFTYTLRAS